MTNVDCSPGLSVGRDRVKSTGYTFTQTEKYDIQINLQPWNIFV